MSVAPLLSAVVAMALQAMLLVFFSLRMPKATVALPHLAASRLGYRYGWADVALLVFRCLVAVYTFSLSCHCDFRNPGVSFTYFTIWGWSLVVVYFSLAATCSALHLAGSGKLAAMEGSPAGELAAWTKHLARTGQLIFSMLAPAALMLDIILWGVLLPADETEGHPAILNFCSYHQHAVNLVFVCIDMSLNSFEIRMHDLVLALWLPTVYFTFTILRVGLNADSADCLTEYSGHCESVWPYFFIDTSNYLVVYAFFAVSLLFCAAYWVMSALSRCAQRKAHRRVLANPRSHSGLDVSIFQAS